MSIVDDIQELKLELGDHYQVKAANDRREVMVYEYMANDAKPVKIASISPVQVKIDYDLSTNGAAFNSLMTFAQKAVLKWHK